MDQQQISSSVVEATISSGSPETLIDQQQTAGPFSAVEKSISSASPESLIDHQQISGPSSAVEEQLRKQITGLEDEVRHIKLDQDREAMKHTLLQEELAQLREKYINLRVDLQMAQEKHQAVENEHHQCKGQMLKSIEEAIKNLSTALDLSAGGSPDLGLTTKGVVSGTSLPPQQSVTNPIVGKTGGTSGAFQFGIPGSTGGGSPVPTNIFSQRPATSTSAGFFHSPSVNTPVASKFGDPQKMVQHEPLGPVVLISTPGFCNNQEQSFEEARLRRYDFDHRKIVAPLTRQWLETSGSSKTLASHKSFDGVVFSGGFFQQSEKGNIGKEGGGWQGQTPSSVDTAGANGGSCFKLVGQEGDETANGTPASSDTGRNPAASPYKSFDFHS